MNKKKTIIIFLMFVCLSMGIFKVATADYVFSGKRFYKKDVKEIEVNPRSSPKEKMLIKKLDQFYNLEDISLGYIKSSDLIDFPYIDSDIVLYIFFSSIDDTSFINNIKSIGVLHLLETEIDFNEAYKTPVEQIDLVSCDVKNLDKMNSIVKLYIYKGSIEGYMKTGEGTYWHYDRSIIYDSSIFSKFDNLKELDIIGVEIQDSTGFEQMKSLTKLRVEVGQLDEATITRLRNKGVEVIEKGES